MSETGVTLKLRGLEQLTRALRRDPPKCRVGILGSHAARKAAEGEKGTLNNAEVGALYEFNDGNNPNRPGGSFLRVPLMDRLEKDLIESGALDQSTLEKVVNSGTVTPWLKKVAIVAEKVVVGAFNTEGYGKWRQSNFAKKKNAQTLVETKQLRESITSEVKE